MATPLRVSLGEPGGGGALPPPSTPVRVTSSCPHSSTTALTGMAVTSAWGGRISSSLLVGRHSWRSFLVPALCLSLSGCAVGFYCWYSTRRKKHGEGGEQGEERVERRHSAVGRDGEQTARCSDVPEGEPRGSGERQFLSEEEREKGNSGDDGAHIEKEEEEEQDLEDLQTSDEERNEAREVTRGVYVQPTQRVKQLKRRSKREGRKKERQGGGDISGISSSPTDLMTSSSGREEKKEAEDEETLRAEEFSTEGTNTEDTTNDAMLFLPGRQKIFVKTFGCAHNQSDSEYMSKQEK